MRLPQPFLRALALVPLGVLGGLADDEIVTEFRRFFRKYEQTPERVEAVLALEGVESTGVVEALVPVLRDETPEVVQATVRVLAGFETRPPVDALLAALEATKKTDERSGLLRVLAEGGYAGTAEFVTPCLEDREWTVRRWAVSALAASGDAEVEAAVATLASDPEPAVRGAVLSALARIGSESAVDLSLAALEDPSWQVRSAAIQALGIVRRTRSVGPLVSRLVAEEGRLREDCARALENLTGRNLGSAPDPWSRFWDTYAATYRIPTDEELALLRAKRAQRAAEYNPNAVNYHGIETPSRAILFVIDVSGSMEAEVIDKERFKDGDYPSYTRMDITKTELVRTIEGLESYVKFNILAFATDVRPWKKSLVAASVLNKSSAIDWTERLEPIGGHSKETLARVGLMGAADLESGKTNTWGALATALAAGEDAHGYEVDVDTIFFLSDGRPTHGRYIDDNDILREVGLANELRRVVIHTIAIGDFQKTFMQRLAENNSGMFVDLGR